MKAQPHELDLLHKEGYHYRVLCRRGWYYKGEWVGYNVKDALRHRAKFFGYTNESVESSRV